MGHKSSALHKSPPLPQITHPKAMCAHRKVRASDNGRLVEPPAHCSGHLKVALP